MDRFASGQTTNKFEVPLPSHIGEQISNLQNANIQAIVELTNNTNERFEHFENETRSAFQQMEAHVTPVITWHDQFSSDVTFHNIQFTNLVKLAVSNPIIRFLNFHVFHWFTLNIAENRYPLFSQHDKYVAYVEFMAPEQFIDDYGYDAYKKEMRETFKRSYKVMKTHLKKIKSEGYTLSNMRFRF